MRVCAHCGGEVEREFRFCPWCAAAQRSKLVEFFLGGEGKALRVSRYLDRGLARFSVWNERGEAEAAVSLDDAEAARLARFLAPQRPRRPSLLERVARR